MSAPSPQYDRTAILDTLAEYHAAMVAARTERLASLTSDKFMLTHITGYVQPREEWFEVIRSGQFDYHQITLENSSLDIEVSGPTATLAGHGIFDATIQGMHRPWRLAFKMCLRRFGEEWVIERAIYHVN